MADTSCGPWNQDTAASQIWKPAQEQSAPHLGRFLRLRNADEWRSARRWYSGADGHLNPCRTLVDVYRFVADKIRWEHRNLSSTRTKLIFPSITAPLAIRTAGCWCNRKGQVRFLPDSHQAGAIPASVWAWAVILSSDGARHTTRRIPPPAVAMIPPGSPSPPISGHFSLNQTLIGGAEFDKRTHLGSINNLAGRTGKAALPFQRYCFNFDELFTVTVICCSIIHFTRLEQERTRWILSLENKQGWSSQEGWHSQARCRTCMTLPLIRWRPFPHGRLRPP